jgi:succinate dehydrogenase/fumarate reductase flavoprotein subunit
MTKEAPDAIIELEHYGCPFSRDEHGKMYVFPLFFSLCYIRSMRVAARFRFDANGFLRY